MITNRHLFKSVFDSNTRKELKAIPMKVRKYDLVKSAECFRSTQNIIRGGLFKENARDASEFVRISRNYLVKGLRHLNKSQFYIDEDVLKVCEVLDMLYCEINNDFKDEDADINKDIMCIFKMIGLLRSYVNTILKKRF